MIKQQRSTYVNKNEVLQFVEDDQCVYGIGICKRFRAHYAAIRQDWKKGKLDLNGLAKRLKPFDVMQEND